MNFSSTGMAPSERAAAYEQALKSAFAYLNAPVDVEIDVDQPEVFVASIEQISIGRLRPNVHRSNASNHLIRVGSNRCTAVELLLVCAGEVSVSNPHGVAHLRTGDMLLRSPAVEWHASHGQFELIAVGLPDTAIRGRTPWLKSSIGKRVSGTSGLAACLTALLRAAAECHWRLRPEEGAILEAAIVEAIGFFSQTDDSASESLPSSRRLDKLETLKSLALNALEREDLSPRTLAIEAGLSTRTVHRLFAASGVSFQSWLKQRRLERCWAELMSSRGTRERTVADVAFAYGFNDLSTFHRAFRARFGTTPKVVRQGARTNAAPVLPGSHRSPGQSANSAPRVAEGRRRRSRVWNR